MYVCFAFLCATTTSILVRNQIMVLTNRCVVQVHSGDTAPDGPATTYMSYTWVINRRIFATFRRKSVAHWHISSSK